jgi:hypothetical protein
LEFSGAAAPSGAACVLGFQNQAEEDAPKIALDFEAAFRVQVLDDLSSSLNLTLVRCKLGPDDTGPSGEQSGTGSGGVGGQSAPPNVAYLIHKATALGGRRGRGRMFLPGVADTDVGTSGELIGEKAATLNSSLFAFGGALTLAGYPLAVLHEGAFPPTLVTQLICDGRVATQRRRLRR